MIKGFSLLALPAVTRIGLHVKGGDINIGSLLEALGEWDGQDGILRMSILASKDRGLTVEQTLAHALYESCCEIECWISEVEALREEVRGLKRDT